MFADSLSLVPYKFEHTVLFYPAYVNDIQVTSNVRDGVGGGNHLPLSK